MYLYTLFRLNDHKSQLLDKLEKEVVKLKEDVNAKSEELDFRQRCLQEFQMMAIEKQVRHVGDASRQEQLRRRSEIFFRYDYQNFEILFQKSLIFKKLPKPARIIKISVFSEIIL